jgi:flagellar biosynthesis/type III secretory pathway chaperone
MHSHQTTQCARLLTPLLQLQLEQVNGFLAYLEAIKQAITQNDKEQLNQLLNNTAPDVKNIEVLQLKLQQTVTDFGYTLTAEGLDECVNDCQQPQLNKLHNDLKQQLKNLQNSLMINDLLVKKNQQRIRQSIRLLSGHQPENSSMTYSSSGNTSEDNSDRHSLARA